MIGLVNVAMDRLRRILLVPIFLVCLAWVGACLWLTSRSDDWAAERRQHDQGRTGSLQLWTGPDGGWLAGAYSKHLVIARQRAQLEGLPDDVSIEAPSVGYSVVRRA